MQPTYRTVTVAWWSWPPSSGCTRFCSSFTPTAAIRGQFQAGLRRVCRRVRVEIVKRSDQAKGFAVLPKRWIVERTIAWLNRCRRLAKDWECLSRKALAFLHLASIRLMLRKLSHTTK